VTRKLILGASALLLAACSHDSKSAAPPDSCSTLPAPAASALPAAQVIELGTHRVGDNVSFTVPAGTGSISIVEQAVGAVPLLTVFNNSGTAQVVDNSAVPRFVFFPDGGTAYDDFNFPSPGADKTIDPSGSYIEYSQDTPVASAFTFPNTAVSLAQGVAAGSWSFIVSDFAHECSETTCFDGGTDLDEYDVKVLLRPLQVGANLDVNFYIVGAVTNPAGVALTAASAANDARVQRMVFTLTSLYAVAGITIGTPKFFDVTAAQRSTYEHIVVSGDSSGQGPCEQLDQMFVISSANPGVTMNLFLVSDLVDTSATGNDTLVGIDGTIPGLSSFSGTVHSGAAVSLADLYAGICTTGGTLNLRGCGADEVAYIAAHETGHFLGLFHTSEMNGDLVDPLDDTGKCICTACAASTANCGKTDGSAPVLEPANCVGSATSSCTGATNLMFWSIDHTISAGLLSSEQSQVMLLNPLIQ
jgi:hypothetical protein